MGAASYLGPCQDCPAAENEKKGLLLGQTTCASSTFNVGDIDGDGILSQREILNLLFVFTNGHQWGDQYKPWRDVDRVACDLPGVSCNSEFQVIRITLKGARLCWNSENSMNACFGLPSEIGLLTNLEVLDLR